MEIAVLVAGEDQRPVLARLMQLYIHDLSRFDGDEVGEDGLFDLGDYFDLYWVEAERYPFLIWVDGGPAGFVLVRELGEGRHSIAEFFVLRRYRRSGVGRVAAVILFDLFKGDWVVAQLAEHKGAQQFWRGVIGGYTGGRFEEGWSESGPKGPMQLFSSLDRDVSRDED